MQTLSDMVFGLALSLGALVLISQPPADPGRLYYGLFIFGFSFVILVTVWYNYASIMAVLPLETLGLVLLNLALLFVVALEPYLLTQVALPANVAVQEPASVLYAFDLAAMNATMAGLTHVLSREERHLVPPKLMHRMRTTRNFTLATAVLFAVSALPVFWTWMVIPNVLPLRILLWTLTLPVGWFRRLWFH